MNQATPEGKDFRQRFPGLSILTPVAFLQALSPKEEEPPAPRRGHEPIDVRGFGYGALARRLEPFLLSEQPQRTLP